MTATIQGARFRDVGGDVQLQITWASPPDPNRFATYSVMSPDDFTGFWRVTRQGNRVKPVRPHARPDRRTDFGKLAYAVVEVLKVTPKGNVYMAESWEGLRFPAIREIEEGLWLPVKE